MGGIYTQLGRADKQGLETGINWYGTAEAKIATDRFLGEIRRGLYTWASGGFAFGEIENRTATLNQSVVATGWTGAVGVNYEFSPNYKVGLTYRHTHLGPKFVDGLRTGVSADSDHVFASFQRDFKPQ
jgi:opacity protein-like surface antigen